ncbi:membrane protein insertase YidC [Mycoplasma sp. SG1]|uniref:membrane protein insertase YidC n=1 Tax=Mycoplasma sp. SG1 TaxID=2810348 RepID=UPI00202469EF|nr:membrane protein insertase YidC [Mycoplasma sp. SG1]URM52842.1 membrane protein insertase YidC [Mycoplasma sp. SG1]
MIQNILSKDSKHKKTPPLKLTIKILKLILFAFLILMAVYGFIQQFVDSRVVNSQYPGSGFEFSFTNHNSHYLIFDSSGNLKENFYNFINNWADSWNYGPFYALFVYPFALFSMVMFEKIGGSGWAVFFVIFLIVVIVRGFTLIFTVPQFKQQLIMSKLQIKISNIKAKYKDKTDKASKQKKQMEMIALYKRYNLKPWSIFSTMFITLPFFYAMYRVFSSVYIIKNASWGPFLMRNAPLSSLLSGHWMYLIIIVIVVPIQFCSFKINSWLTNKKSSLRRLSTEAKNKYKSSQTITYVLIVVFSGISVFVPFSLTIYWSLTGIFTIVQTCLFYYFMQHRKIKKME